MKKIALELLGIYQGILHGIVEKIPDGQLMKAQTLVEGTAVVADYRARIEAAEPELITSSQNEVTPMTVYLLSAHEYSDWTILGIYSTREKAEAAKAHYERPRTNKWNGTLYYCSANDIETWTLDEEPTQ